MEEITFQEGFTTRHIQPNWWLRLTSYKPALDPSMSTLKESQQAQRSQTAAWILLCLFVLQLFHLIMNGNTLTTQVDLVIGLAILTIATLLNRHGHTTTVGILLNVMIATIILLDLITDPGGIDVVDLPIYDLLALTLIISAAILPLQAILWNGAANCVLIIADFMLQTRSPDLIKQIAILETPALLSRPIFLNVVIALALFLFTRNQRLAYSQEYAALSLAQERTRLATASHESAQELMVIQHYTNLFFESIATCIANHLRGVTSSITLNFSAPQSLLEQRTQNRITTEATRFNHLLSRLDRSEEQRNWDLTNFLMTVRHYNHLLSRCLTGGDLSLIHPIQFGTTNDANLDAMIALVFANIVGSATWNTLKNSHLTIPDPTIYADSTRKNALVLYQHAAQTAMITDTVPPALPDTDAAMTSPKPLPQSHHLIPGSQTTLSEDLQQENSLPTQDFPHLEEEPYMITGPIRPYGISAQPTMPMNPSN